MEITATGGARLSWFNASWPLATLRASANRLSLSLGLFGSWDFSPEEVIRLETRSALFGLSGGVRIVHAKEQYPREIVFLTLGRPDSLLRRIGAAGFRPHPGGEQISAASRIEARGSNPMRWSFIVAALAVWNGLLLLDWRARGWEAHGIGPLTVLAMGLVVLVSFGLTRSARIQELVLKPGRSVSEILPVVRLAQLISGVTAAAVALDFLFRSA